MKIEVTEILIDNKPVGFAAIIRNGKVRSMLIDGNSVRIFATKQAAKKAANELIE